MKKIITIIASFIATQVILLAGPLDGTWVNTEAASDRSKVIISTTGGVSNFISYSGSRVGVDMKLTMLGDSVSEKSPDKYATLVKNSGFKKETYLIYRKEDKLVIQVVSIYTDGGSRSSIQKTHIYKK